MEAHLLVPAQSKVERTFGNYGLVATERNRLRKCCASGFQAADYIPTIQGPKPQEYFCLPFLLFGDSVFPITVGAYSEHSPGRWRKAPGFYANGYSTTVQRVILGKLFLVAWSTFSLFAGLYK